MKGTVVSTWIKTCRKLRGDKVVDEALTNSGIDKDKVFSPLEDVDDNVVKNIIGYIARNENMSTGDLWRKIGQENITTFSEDYPAFFEHDNLYNFFDAMYEVHIIVAKRIPGAHPPILKIRPISSREAIFSYNSKRGMFDYFFGLIDGSSKYFNEKIQISEMSRTSDSVELKLTFEKDIYKNKNYILNKFMSFGFIKNINVKIALLSVIIFIVLDLCAALIAKDIPEFVRIIFAFASTITASSLLNKPLKVIVKDFEKIKTHNYVENGEIHTNDIYETMYENLNGYKDSVKGDFVGFKGLTDEMNTFSDNLTTISEKMSGTSEGISGVVEQVASAATTQAEDTEHTVEILNDNVESIKNVVNNEKDNKDQLENAVLSIENTFGNVKETADKLSLILNKFEEVKNTGAEIQQKVEGISEIVSLVSSISSQTNLLALNAAIEAQRAGEAGRGFSVVADEVRKLSEQTKDAVDSINVSLTEFIKDIEKLIEGVSDQFDTLKDENKRLNSAVNESSTSNERIRVVTKNMIKTSEKLTEEVESFSQVFEKIESLAAIAEENSASSEEVSADVNTYTEELKKLTGSIMDFKKLTEEFKNDLDIYKI
jgi:methyl-accepting chemotaxis protein